MKNLAAKINSWMVQNLERPFFLVEMARAVPEKEKNGVFTAVHVSVAVGVSVMVCLLFASVV